MNATDFKQKCLSVLDNLDSEGVVITKRGKAIARVIPITADSARLIGIMKGRLTVKGDILSTGQKWDAEPRHSHPRPRARRKSVRP